MPRKKYSLRALCRAKPKSLLGVGPSNTSVPPTMPFISYNGGFVFSLIALEEKFMNSLWAIRFNALSNVLSQQPQLRSHRDHDIAVCTKVRCYVQNKKKGSLLLVPLVSGNNAKGGKRRKRASYQYATKDIIIPRFSCARLGSKSTRRLLLLFCVVVHRRLRVDDHVLRIVAADLCIEVVAFFGMPRRRQRAKLFAARVLKAL